jgi:hypothetical protein
MNGMVADPLQIVREWQEAVNDRDLERLRAVSAAEIAIVGPRGVGHGFALLADWLGRAGLALTTRRSFVRDDAVVMEQEGVWSAVESGEARGAAIVASAFRVAAGRVSWYARYDTLSVALNEVGLTMGDEVRGG